jgi:hypothetical protein
MAEPDPEALHPYDGRERRFSHADAEPEALARGRELVARLLSLPEPPSAEGLRYELSFYSGGIGVIDRLHVAMPCVPAEVEGIATRAGMIVPEALRVGDERREEFDWLVHGEEHPQRSLEAAVVAFVDDNRRAFQPRPHEGMRTWFWPDSDVNTWSLLYEIDGELAFIAYDQG